MAYGHLGIEALSAVQHEYLYMTAETRLLRHTQTHDGRRAENGIIKKYVHGISVSALELSQTCEREGR